MEFMNFVDKISNTIGIQLVKYYDFTNEEWQEGMLCEKISNDKNIWKVYFPSTFTKESYFLAIEVKEGTPQKDYCAYRFEI